VLQCVLQCGLQCVAVCVTVCVAVSVSAESVFAVCVACLRNSGLGVRV